MISKRSPLQVKYVLTNVTMQLCARSSPVHLNSRPCFKQVLKNADWLQIKLSDGDFSMADVAETIRKDKRDTGLLHDVIVLKWSSLQELQFALRDGTE
jgi:hypothetical protein